LPWPAAFAAAALTALPGDVRAEDIAALLEPVSAALGLERVAALRIRASGSEFEPIGNGRSASPAEPPADAPPAGASTPAAATPARTTAADDPLYVPPPPPPTRRHRRIAHESWALDLETATLTIEREHADGGGAARASGASARTVGPDASWNERHRYWLTPHGFVRGALSASAAVSAGAIDGKPHRIVRFTPDGGAEVRAWIDDDDRLVRIATTVDDGDGGPVSVEASLLHWEALGGIEYPTTWIRRENDELAEVLIVREIGIRARD